MADPQGGLIFVLDENSTGLRAVLLASRTLPEERLKLLPELGIPNGTLDAEMLAALGQGGRFTLIARDGRMLEPLLQRQAWQGSGVTLFLLGKDWGRLPLRELSRRVLFVWPGLVERAEEGGQGKAWRVSPGMPNLRSNTFRPVTARPDDQEANRQAQPNHDA
jgi:hypothetical protein